MSHEPKNDEPQAENGAADPRKPFVEPAVSPARDVTEATTSFLMATTTAATATI